MGESIQNNDFEKNPNIADGLKPILQNIDEQFNLNPSIDENAVKAPIVTDISEIFAPAKKEVTPKPDLQVSEQQKEAIEFKKRYGDSSEEALRLFAENQKYAPFKKILDKLVEDQGMTSKVNALIDSQGTPKSVLESLGLPDDFEFNQKEANEIPSSDSAKLQYAVIGDAVEKRFNQLHDKSTRATAISDQKKEIRKEIGDDDVYNKFMDFLGKFKPNYKDFLRLFTMNEREKLIATEAGKRVLSQVEKASAMGGNLGGLGDIESDLNTELGFFKDQFGFVPSAEDDTDNLIT